MTSLGVHTTKDLSVKALSNKVLIVIFFLKFQIAINIVNNNTVLISHRKDCWVHIQSFISFQILFPFRSTQRYWAEFPVQHRSFVILSLKIQLCAYINPKTPLCPIVKFCIGVGITLFPCTLWTEVTVHIYSVKQTLPL